MAYRRFKKFFDDALAYRRAGARVRQVALRKHIEGIERRIAGIRLALILFNGATYLLSPPALRPSDPLAFVILGAALAYSLALMHPRSLHFLTGTLQSRLVLPMIDGLVLAVWIVLTGGGASPYFIAWYAGIVAANYRLKGRDVITITAVYAVVYVTAVEIYRFLYGTGLDLFTYCLRLGYFALAGSISRLVVRLSTSTSVATYIHEAGLEESMQATRLLNAANERLEDEVRLRTHDLEAANARLRREIDLRARTETELIAAREHALAASRAKSDFLANVSHEIRTPLNAITGFTELLANDLPPDPTRTAYFRAIRKNSDLLASIIGDLLDINRIESGTLEMKYKQASLANILEDLKVLTEPAAREKGLQIDISLETGLQRSTLMTDPTRLRQILLHLVANAVKFTNSGAVTVRAWKARDQVTGTSFLAIDVQDTGQGMGKAMRENIFKPFHQENHDNGRRFGGTGLGLAISKKLAQALGGDLTLVSSITDFGSLFRVSLPIPLVTADAAAPAPAGTTTGKPTTTPGPAAAGPVPSGKPPLKTPLTGLRILLVDDAPDNQILMKHMLTRAGATVDLADNGLNALEKVQISNFDLVLMDLQMPEMDGFEATRRMRELGYTLPIIAVTAHAQMEVREQSLAAGMNDFLTKPVHYEQVINTILQHRPVLVPCNDPMPAPSSLLTEKSVPVTSAPSGAY